MNTVSGLLIGTQSIDYRIVYPVGLLVLSGNSVPFGY